MLSPGPILPRTSEKQNSSEGSEREKEKITSGTKKADPGKNTSPALKTKSKTGPEKKKTRKGSRASGLSFWEGERRANAHLQNPEKHRATNKGSPEREKRGALREEDSTRWPDPSSLRLEREGSNHRRSGAKNKS